MVPEYGTDGPTDPSYGRTLQSNFTEDGDQEFDELEPYPDDVEFVSEDDLSSVDRTNLFEKMIGFSQESIENGELDWDNYGPEPEPEGSEERNSGEEQGSGDILQSQESDQGKSD